MLRNLHPSDARHSSGAFRHAGSSQQLEPMPRNLSAVTFKMNGPYVLARAREREDGSPGGTAGILVPRFTYPTTGKQPMRYRRQGDKFDAPHGKAVRAKVIQLARQDYLGVESGKLSRADESQRSSGSITFRAPFLPETPRVRIRLKRNGSTSLRNSASMGILWKFQD